MSKGRKALEWCRNYHCAGDCGLPGFGYQHRTVSLEQQRHKRLTLAAFDVLASESKGVSGQRAAQSEGLAVSAEEERDDDPEQQEWVISGSRMPPLTPAQRKAAERQHRKEAGLVRLELYVHPEDREAIRNYAAGLASKRENAVTRPKPALAR